MSSPPWRKIISTQPGTPTMYSAKDMNDIMDLFDGVNTGKAVTINNSWTFTPPGPSGVSITDKTKLPADALYDANSRTVTGKTMDYNANTFLNFPFNPAGAGTGAPTSPNTYSALQTFRDHDFALRNPANTNTLTFRNPVITGADYDFQFNAPFDYYIFIDPDDANKIKCKDGRTGAIVSSHASHADVPIQFAIDALSAGSVRGGPGPVPGTGDFNGVWTGGKYGSIFIGPGLYYFYQAVILKSNILIQCSGAYNTTFTFPDNLYPGLNNNTFDMFKSSTWDALSIATTGLNLGDLGVTLRDFTIDGNYRNNIIPAANTATTTGLGTPASPETAGTDSWGHGIAFYGRGLTVENATIHSCPGAGIIVQGSGGLQGGYTYPINTFTNMGGGGPGKGPTQLLNRIHNVFCIGNGRQGILVRSLVNISDYWSYWNGEAGLDFQSCAYFKGSGWAERIEIFEDGWQHGAQAAPQNTAYDPLGFECRMLVGGVWISDAWIETSMGNGDNLMIGSNGGISNPTGYQIDTSAANHMLCNIYMDYPRSAAIHMNGNNCVLKNVFVKAVPQANTYYDPTSPTPMRLTGFFNDIDITYTGFLAANYASSGGSSPNGVVLGNSASPATACWGNRLKLNSLNNDYCIDNQSSNTYAMIDCNFVNTTAGAKYFLKPGGQTFDYTRNQVRIATLGYNSSNLSFRESNGGVVTLTGATGVTAYTIAHQLYAAPNVFSVAPANAAAVTAGTYYLTADATNLTVNFTTAPANGSSNQFRWSARVSP